MSTYTVYIELDHKVVDKRSSDNLCLARKVNNEFCIVFLGKAIYPTGNQLKLQLKDELSWEEQFRVFGAQPFQASLPVSAVADSVDISFGQTATIASNRISPAQTSHNGDFQGVAGEKGSAGDSFVLARVPSSMRAACECKTGNQEWHSIYVDDRTHVTVTDIVITPSHEYVIFWDPYLVPNTMFRYNARPEKHEFSFETGVTKKSFRFGYQVADQPALNEEAMFFPIPDQS